MVDDAVLIAGRDRDCDVVLDHDDVAGRHCAFAAHGPELIVRDLDSPDGTFINQRRVDDGVAWAGDTVRLGSCLLDVRESEPAARFETVMVPDRGYESVIQKRFEPSRLAWLSAVAPGAEAALLQRVRRYLSMLNHISELLAGARDIHGLSDATVRGILELTAADRAAVVLRRTDPSTGDLEVAASRSRAAASTEFSVSRTLLADVIDQGVSTFAHDASADRRFNGTDGVAGQGIRSVMCVPLRTADDILGALYVDSLSGTGCFTEADLDLLSAIGNHAGVALHRVRLQQQLERHSLEALRAIAATIDAKDGYTHRHSERVAMLAKRLGTELGLPPDQLETIELSALLHDVGKIAVPDAILNKPGQLTPDEFAQMKQHPGHGARILENIQSPAARAVLPGVKHHHERWDGSGYPDGLRGDDIPLLPRLLGIADFYDAVTSPRSYRAAMPAPAAIDLIKAASGSHFEPSLVALVVRLHGRGELLPEGWE
jgi:GAF domain-containing protein